MGHDRDDDDRGYRRTYDRDADMGGSHWSGASGRGGIMYRPRWGEGRPGDRERGREPGYGREWLSPEGRHFTGNDFDDGDPRRGTDMGFASPYHQQQYETERRERERGPHWGKGPKGYRRSDARILEDVCETIADQGHIDASDVEVKVEDGVVILSGTVGLRHQKRALEMLVENCRGVEEVKNELRLRRARDRERERGDADRAVPAPEGPRSNGRSGTSNPRS